MEKNGTEEILKRISDRRKELGMSYQDLADATGLAKTTLQRYETGHITNIPINRIDALAKGLQCSPAYIMGWTECEDDNFADKMKMRYGRIFDIVDRLNEAERKKAQKLLEDVFEK